MQRIGIVAEYNPFHNGHLYQIGEIRKRFGSETFIGVVTSGNFVQRGEFSYMDKWEKTKAALDSGVDLVVEMPLYYSIQNAEIFARMSTRILEKLGMDFQVFGAEEENREVLEEVLKIQSHREYGQRLMEYMKKGNSYSASQREVLSLYGLKDIVRSNNILALEYMRTMKNYKLKIKPYIIKREVSEYNEKKIEKQRKKIASATFIRNILENDNGGDAVKAIKDFVPKFSYNILEEKVKIDSERGISSKKLKEESFRFFKYKLLMETKKEIIKIYDLTEEIYARIYRETKKSDTYEMFFQRVKSRNFSNKRIERIIFNILLDITKESMDFELDYIRVLGFNGRGREYLRKLKLMAKAEASQMTNYRNFWGKYKGVFVNWKDIEKNVDSEKVKIEKNGFLIKELFTGEKERLNPLIYDK